MPAIRNKQPHSLVEPNDRPQSPTKGWTKDQKRQLFYHVIKNGEKDWKIAVEGKTGHQKNAFTSN
uniref:Myb-like domain-containing protein n=1 Tax=Kwoniella pini CBS 10737 TaxID=1296096 RepID=A0A1B9HV94_9TREE|nr:uncharacterized protein I206_06973 [Kwoniella pini CBS 10737]OCF47195.1 hypothetical protein I206_06973 [Kwoniella pini CBS 10737]